jgi:type II secretory pathway pseudopilin PulG
MSPTLEALVPHREQGTVVPGIKERVPDTLFAYGDEVIARPSATCRYLVPDLEMGFQEIDLGYDFDSVGARRRKIQLKFDKERGEVIVRMIVPNEVADHALLHAQLANTTWNLRALFEAVNQAIQEAALSAGQVAREAMQEAVSAAGQVAREAMQETVQISGKAIALAETEDVPAPTETQALPDDASVADVTTRLAELTGLHDRELGELFPGQVSREHVQRWRTGKRDNPTAANRRRMWFLVRLFEGLVRGGVTVREWIRNPTTIDERTPYDLLRVGRFDEVEHLVAQMLPAPEPVEIVTAEGRHAFLEQGPAVFTPRTQEPTDDLVYDEEDGWIEIEEDLDDETDDG